MCHGEDEGKNPKNVWWNYVVNDTVGRKEAIWKDLLGARNEVPRERCMKVYKEERLKGVYIRVKRR